MITEDISVSGYTNWNIDAGENDIIEYDGTQWAVSFDSSSIDNVKYVTNTNTNKQFKWHNDSWISSHEGVYNSGFWRLIL